MKSRFRTPTQLTDFLDHEMVWRRKEIHDLRREVHSPTAGSALTQDTVVRAGIALVYAHWEGFVKAVAEAYVEFVYGQRLTHEALAAPFLAMLFRVKLARLERRSPAANDIAVAQFLQDEMQQTLRTNLVGRIKTKSNLSFSVLQSIVEQLGCDPRPYSSSEQLINRVLVPDRCTVAHGQYLVEEDSAFEQRCDKTIALMELFRNQVENAVVAGSYRRT